MTDHISIMFVAKFFQEPLDNISLQISVVVINLALLVDKAIHFYNLDCHNRAPPAKVIINHEVDLLVTKSQAISITL